jgi:hypothetical protein
MRWHPASGLGVIALGNATYAPMTRAARRAHDELLRLLDAPTHRQTSPWTDTTASVGDVERLALDTFDDSAADALLAENIDLDLPRVERKADLAHAVAVAGRIEMAEPPSLESDGPAHATWSRAGADGRLDFTIRMSPERETRVQTMLVAAVPTPPEPVWTAIRVLAGWLDAPAESGGLGASWPTKVRTGSEFSPEPFLRAASLARALGGPFELDSAPVSVDPAGRWTFALRTPSLTWHLVIGADIGGAGTMPALGSDGEPAATVTVTHCSLSLVPLTSR